MLVCVQKKFRSLCHGHIRSSLNRLCGLLLSSAQQHAYLSKCSMPQSHGGTVKICQYLNLARLDLIVIELHQAEGVCDPRGLARMATAGTGQQVIKSGGLEACKLIGVLAP